MAGLGRRSRRSRGDTCETPRSVGGPPPAAAVRVFPEPRPARDTNTPREASAIRGHLVGVLAAGSLAFGGFALLRPERVARMIHDDTTTARALGIRDLGAGLALLASPSARGPVVARLVFDLGDGILFGRGNPKVAAMAFGFAAIGIAALAAR